jgi:hypothetical protein
MTQALDQIAAELKAVNENLSRLTKTIQTATGALYAGQILAGRINTNYDEEIIRAQNTHDAILKAFKDINEQPRPQGGISI